MPHQIHQTKGIILKGSNIGESDKLLTVFTEKFGKIHAKAQGARYLKSKLRYNLENFSYSNLSLILNRGYWRITGAEEIQNRKQIISEVEKQKTLSRVSILLNKMIQGEETDFILWQIVESFFNTLSKENRPPIDQLKKLETSTVAKILIHLGYLNEEECKTEKCTITAINTAIKESML
ncbi:MAG: DNA repair protein RecO [Candidatus Levybacteria bacterium CG10_big_fil_rev_8_21_14_0_10_36_7]|nr:MAG: DNA repair protein RecO [Candidatus Levybacteria bacterium CG10_big_fil_rev_8_21_14_0_10_36_7]